MRDWYVWVIVGFVAAVWGCWMAVRRERELAAIRFHAIIDQQKKISLEEGRTRGYEEGFAECKSVIESMIWDETFDRVFRAVHPLGLPFEKAVKETREALEIPPLTLTDVQQNETLQKTIEEAREASKCALADWRNKFARVVARRREDGLLTDNQRRES